MGSTDELCEDIAKVKTVKKRSRRAEKTEVLTSSPFKKALREKQSQSAKPTAAKGKGKSCSKSKGKGKAKQPKKKCADTDSEQEEFPCLVCGEDFAHSKPREKWIACFSCGKWAHEECTPGIGLYVCQNCDSDDDNF